MGEEFDVGADLFAEGAFGASHAIVAAEEPFWHWLRFLSINPKALDVSAKVDN